MITKFIKYNENLKDQFFDSLKIGDYLLLDLDEMDAHNKRMEFDTGDQIYPDDLGKLTSFNKTDEKTGDVGDLTYFYGIEFHNGKKVFVRKEEIIRLLTPDEIEEYETKKEAKKYNI